jgi:hypothetical protein
MNKLKIAPHNIEKSFSHKISFLKAAAGKKTIFDVENPG